MSDILKSQDQLEGDAAGGNVTEVCSSESTELVDSTNVPSEREVDLKSSPIEIESHDLGGEKTNDLRSIRDIDQLSRKGPTGPRTIHGKRTSSHNATKHGIFSRATLIKGESREEFDELLDGLRRSIPRGSELENIYVDMMASNLWRQHRALLAEGAHIQINSLNAVVSTRRYEVRTANSSNCLIATIDRPDDLEFCFELLTDLRQGISERGFDEKDDMRLLNRIYDNSDRCHPGPTLKDEYLTCLCTSRITDEERDGKDFAPPDVCKSVVLEKIDAEIARLKEYRLEEKRSKEAAIERAKLEMLQQRVPDSPGQERFLRYLQSLRREFECWWALYERAQRIRKGQPLPPQLDIKVL